MQKFIKGEITNMLDALNEKNTPHLLEVFSRDDLNEMKEQVKLNM